MSNLDMQDERSQDQRSQDQLSQDQRSQDQRSQDHLQKNSPLTILVVDDDTLDQLNVKRALRARHPEAVIQEAMTCADATQVILSHHFDCVFLDYHLPDGDGVTCLIEVRKAGNDTPVILLTGQDEERLAAEAIQAGASDYLPKSEITPHLLAHSLHTALRFHQAQARTRQAEARTRQAEARTRQAQDELLLRDRAIAAASNGIIICDRNQEDWPIIYCNPAFSAMTGYLPEEVLGHNCRFLQGPETDRQFIQQIRECLQAESYCQIVLRNYKKDGTPFWNELTLSPVRDAAGTLTHFIGVQTDITERRDAEEALRQSVSRQQALLRDMFASVTEGKLILCASEEDLPPPLTPLAGSIPLSRTGGIRELRQQTLAASLEAGLPEERGYDLEIAVGEAAMNAVVHSTSGIGRVFRSVGMVQVRVQDEGEGIAVADLPSATLRRGFSTAGTMGHGFKMILKTADRVYLLTGVAGTTIVLEQNRMALLSDWLSL